MVAKVKICGITSAEDACNAVWAGADALGFVFFKDSKRCILPKEAKKIIDILPPWIFKVGLFVNEEIPAVKKTADYCGLDFVQLHGDETQSYLKELSTLRIIKAIRLRDKDSLVKTDGLACELVLFDAYCATQFGGTGTAFDWRLAKEIRKTKKPYIISGGLTPENVTQAVTMFRPYAVDVSSGVEKAPGKKDKKLMKEFITHAKTT